MSEKIADALRMEAELWIAGAREGNNGNSELLTQGQTMRLVAVAFNDLAARLDSQRDEPRPEPGGESTPDKPF